MGTPPFLVILGNHRDSRRGSWALACWASPPVLEQPVGMRQAERHICGARTSAGPAACLLAPAALPPRSWLTRSSLAPSPHGRHTWSSWGYWLAPRSVRGAQLQRVCSGNTHTASRSGNTGTERRRMFYVPLAPCTPPGFPDPRFGRQGCGGQKAALGSPPLKQDKNTGPLGTTHPGLLGTRPVKSQGKRRRHSVTPALGSLPLGEAPPSMD